MGLSGWNLEIGNEQEIHVHLLRIHLRKKKKKMFFLTLCKTASLSLWTHIVCGGGLSPNSSGYVLYWLLTCCPSLLGPLSSVMLELWLANYVPQTFLLDGTRFLSRIWSDSERLEDGRRVFKFPYLVTLTWAAEGNQSSISLWKMLAPLSPDAGMRERMSPYSSEEEARGAFLRDIRFFQLPDQVAPFPYFCVWELAPGLTPSSGGSFFLVISTGVRSPQQSVSAWCQR